MASPKIKIDRPTGALLWLGGCIGLGVAFAFAAGALTHEANVDKREYRTRAQDVLTEKELTVITLGGFKRDFLCNDNERPLTAAFVAKNSTNQVVEGRVCLAANRPAKLTLNVPGK